MTYPLLPLINVKSLTGSNACGVTVGSAGTCKLSTSSVIAMANTASLNASSRRVATLGDHGRWCPGCPPRLQPDG
jgi:hypothetical protein